MLPESFFDFKDYEQTFYSKSCKKKHDYKLNTNIFRFAQYLQRNNVTTRNADRIKYRYKAKIFVWGFNKLN